MLEYTQSGKFYIDVCVASLSAIQRWHFARALDVRETKGTAPRLGSALLAFYVSTRDIVRGGDTLTEHMANRDPCAGVLRLSLYGPLMRAYLYHAEKNMRAYVAIPSTAMFYFIT